MLRGLFTIPKRMCSKSSGNIGVKVRPPISMFGVEGRYVTALYSAASQMNELEAVEKAFKGLIEIIAKPKMIDFVKTSMISGAEKGKIIKSAGEAAGMPKAAINFLVVVAENGRLKNLKKMLTMFHAVMVAHRNEALCEVITAKPLDESTRKSLLEAIKKLSGGKNVTLTEKVDPDIIGGMIVGIDDKHVDMSIAKKLQMYTEIIKQSV